MRVHNYIFIVFIAWVTSGCNPSDALTDRNGGTSSSDKGDTDDDGFETGKESTTVTGASLTYDRAATECSANVSDEIVTTVCNFQVIQDDNSRIPATSVAPGVNTLWYAPKDKATGAQPDSLYCFDLGAVTNICVFFAPSSATTYYLGYKVSEDDKTKDILVEKEIAGSEPLSNVVYFINGKGLTKSDLSYNNAALELPILNITSNTAYTFDTVNKKIFLGGSFTGHGGSLFKMDPDGSHLESVTTTSGTIASMSLDTANSKIYFAVGSDIKRMNFDGTIVETVYDGMNAITFLKYNSIDGKIYFIETPMAEGDIFTISTSGTNKTTVVSRDTKVFGLDSVNQKLFYIGMNGSGNPALFKSNLDGSGEVELTTSVDAGPYAMAYHTASNKLYINDGSKIYSINPDGTLPADIVASTGGGNALFFNETEDKLFYSASLYLMYKADLNGLNSTIILDRPVITQMVIDPVEHLFFLKDDFNEKIWVYDEINKAMLPAILKNYVNFSNAGIAIDTKSKKIIFGSDATDTLYTANYDGTDPNTLHSGAANIGPMIVQDDVLYWQEGTAIKKMNTDETGLGVAITNLGHSENLKGMFVDPSENKIGYCYTTPGMDSLVARGSLLTGANIETVLTLSANISIGCSNHHENGRIYYFTGSSTRRVERDNTNLLTAGFTDTTTTAVVLP